VKPRIYLDHAATSPLRPEARAAMEHGFDIWANPSSPHAEGRKAKAALEDARERCKRALGWDGELIFTSGASEALWIALNRVKLKRRIVSAVEHDAVFRAAPDAEVIPVYGYHDGKHAGALNFNKAPDFTDALVAVQTCNSETGRLMHYCEGSIFERVHAQGGLVLADCSQSAGEAPDGADLRVVSAHKFGGPIGIGALLVRSFDMLEPIGGHERGYRQGTENLPGAMGMAAALEAEFEQEWRLVTEEQSLRFDHELSSQGAEMLKFGPTGLRIKAVSHPTLSAQALLIRLDAMGFAVSAGSACSSGTLKKSRVLDAFGVPDDVASRTIRVSLGWNTTPEELDAFVEAWASLT